MKLGRTTCMAVVALMTATMVFAQEGEGRREGARGSRRGGGGQGGMPQMREIFKIMGTVRALRSGGRALDEPQRTELGKALDALVTAMKEAQGEFEAALEGVLTAEQLAKFKEAKSQGPRRGRRGQGGGGQGKGGGKGGGKGSRRQQQ